MKEKKNEKKRAREREKEGRCELKKDGEKVTLGKVPRDGIERAIMGFTELEDIGS